MKNKIIQRLLLLLLFMIGAGDTWAETFTPDVKMTYVNYDDPDRSFGEIPSYSAARAGYNGISGGNVVFPRTDWGYNYITYIQVDASLITGTITNATLTAQVSGAIDGTRSTAWGVGYNNSVWSSSMTYNTADKSITTMGEPQYTGVTTEYDFEYKSFDITSAFYNDGDKIVTIVVYETVGGAGYIANPTVTITYTPATEVAYIEDISYDLTTVCKATGASYSPSTGGYLRFDENNKAYPIKTTGSDATNTTEGDPIYVTASKNGKSSYFALRIKTRNALSPIYDSATNTFVVGSTLGMFTSQIAYMSGMTLYLGAQGHTPVVRSVNGDYGLTIIDSNGWTFGNYAYDDKSGTYHEWGTVYKIYTTEAKNLSFSGYFASTSSNALQLYDGSNNAISGMNLSNPGDGSLVSATFALEANQWYLLYVPGSVFSLKTLSYGDASFANCYAVTTVGSTYTQAVTNLYNPVYSIVDKQGDIASTGVTIDPGTGEVSGITAGGALKIQAAGGGKTAVCFLTVAYPATDYPGRQWNFCTDVDETDNEVRRELEISDNLKNEPTAGATAYDSYGEEWRAENKRWYRTKGVEGDNAFIVKETNGLVFLTDEHNFYLRNDAGEYTHIGIRGNGASFTIPALAEGDIVEIMWRHETSSSGTKFTATNVTDLRGKDVSEEFLITESARRGNSNTRFVGYYSFIAKGGDATFTLRDAGNCNIQSIRIYKGPYKPTMRDINLSNNDAAPTTMLLDNAQQGYTYNYCNQLYSTATGPAIYVLKGYRKNNGGGTLGVDYDHEGCVTGSNAAKTPAYYTDEDAYPVTDEEKARLYELRKNIIGFEMYNATWQSANNSYNNGVIKATSGWGKVTIRLNNYTNDMKYVIGYTHDYTLTIGSAPHQEYPYTWDFTKISGAAVTGQTDNVLYSIEKEGSNATFTNMPPTNWLKNANGQFILNTDNSGDTGSQYVPGAVLVTQDRALSRFKGVDYDDKWAKDELDGLGFDGDITMHIDNLPGSSGWNRNASTAQWNSLLSFKITDFATFVKTGEDDEELSGTWQYSQEEQDAGNGRIKLNHEDGSNHIDESYIPSGGIGFRLDGGETKYIHVIPESTLQVGDVISVTAYNAYGSRDAGISFNKAPSTSQDYVAQTMMLGNSLVEETLTYTVTTNDGLDGRGDFYLFRNTNTVHITAIEISRKASTIQGLDWSIYTLTETTVTVPDLNAGGKQDWIYVSASAEPVSVTNATKVTEGTDGPDAKTDVYKYKVTNTGNSEITFATGTKIYKIGVTHILKAIHPVGGTGWATEIRKHDIDHELTGYFTKNDVNAYTVKYDSYDMETATVALTPVNEDGYVPEKTGIVMRLDNTGGLSDANAGKNVPLFYPSYTRDKSSTPVDFPANNLMYNVDEGIEDDNRNYYEEYYYNGNYTKFILTNKYWTFDKDHALSTDEAATQHVADAAGFYRMHIWKTGDVETKNKMPAHSAYLLVPSDNLPAAVWTLQSGYSAARGSTLGVYNIIGPDSGTAISQQQGLEPDGKTSPVYTLDGRRLAATPSKPGVYIIGGKKVMVR